MINCINEAFSCPLYIKRRAIIYLILKKKKTVVMSVWLTATNEYYALLRWISQSLCFQVICWDQDFYFFSLLLVFWSHSQQYLTAFLENVFSVHWHQCLNIVIPSNQKDKTQQQQKACTISHMYCEGICR